MNTLTDMWAWLTDPANWAGASGIGVRLGEHIVVTLLCLAIAFCIAFPLGVAVGHTHRGSALAGAVVGVMRAVPSLGIITLFGLLLGIGLVAPVIALVVLAVPSLLAGTYAGIDSVDGEVVDAARASGMTTRQIIVKVELPLAMPVIIGGVRAACLQVVSTATLAAYTADVGLGRFLFTGLKTNDYPLTLAAAVLVIALAAVLELLWATLQRAARA